MDLRSMMEARATAIASMRALTNSPAGNGGDLSAEQSAQFEKLKGELEGLEKRIERQRLLDEAERRMQGERIVTSGDARLDDELRQFSLRRAICMQVPDLAAQIDCAREREISQELARRSGRPFKGICVPYNVLHVPLEKRVLTAAAEAANLIASDLRADQFIDALKAAMVVRRLGARVLTGLVGDVALPKITTGVAASWVADDGALSAADPDLTQVVLEPRHAGMITEFSRSTLLQSTPDIETVLRRDFAGTLAVAIDRAALKGGGPAANQPSGVITTSGVTDKAIGVPVYDDFLDMIATVEVNNALEGSLGWAMAPRVKKKLRGTVRVASTDSMMIMESARTLCDYPALATSSLAGTAGSPDDGEIIFGDWSQLLIGFWSELDVLVNPYESTAYSKGNVQIRAMATCDVALRHTQAFIFANDVDVD